MSERLTVAVRVRPFLPSESLAGCVTVRGNQIVVGQSKSFAFDRVFDTTATSDDVYVALGQPLADSFLSGYHASTIAYGQTGAGKTFTMAALLNDTVQEIFCRLAEEREEEEAEERKERGAAAGASTTSGGSAASAYTLSLTVLEVYNEAVGDLLSRHAGEPGASTVTGGGGGGGNRSSAADKKAIPSSPLTAAATVAPTAAAAAAATQRGAMQLREDPAGGVYVVGLTEMVVESEGRLLALIDEAIGNRKTASTLMNATSSRSHCVITLTLQRKGLCSRCCFVDLAGSERLKKSLGVGSPTERQSASGGGGAGGGGLQDGGGVAVRMREGININSGLLALGNVIVALCEKKPHVPYRSSKLTRLLQPMLEGNSRTAIIACVGPVASSLEETLNTLKYADRAKQIHVDPRLAVAAVTSTAEAQQVIAMLRQELEEAKRRLAAAQQSSTTAAASSSSNGSSPMAVEPVELERLRELLEREQEVTRRLEGELFDAEYTAMVEVERRKALEDRVAQLEAAAAAVAQQQQQSREEVEEEEMEEEDGDADSTDAGDSPPSPHSRLTQNMARLQRLEEERDSLAAMRARRVRDAEQLEAALRADGTGAAAAAASASTAFPADAMTVEQLSDDIQQKEDQIARLQRDNEDVMAQLAQYERELQDAVAERARLQGDLRRAESLLEQSAMQSEMREAERAALRAAYVERIRKAEGRAAEYRRRVKEAEQEMRLRQENITRTRQLQERVVQLREEVSRQRAAARTVRKQTDQRSAAHQHEVLQLQRQLQQSTSQLAQLHLRMDKKDAAIARIKRQLAEQQQQQQEASVRTASSAATPPPPPPAAPVVAHPKTQAVAQASQPPQTTEEEGGGDVQPRSPAPHAHVAMHKMPAHKLASARKFSGRTSTASSTPPAVALADIPSSDSSPVRVVKRPVTLSSLHIATASSASASQRPLAVSESSAQVLIDRELQDLERLEQELGELQQYRQVLLSAHNTDAPKWHRAREGFTRRLAALEAEVRAAETGTPSHAALAKEEREVREKLLQLQAYQPMFEDAAQQLAEFDNRIDNLHEARKFHLQRIRRLQQRRTAAAEDGEGAAGERAEASHASVRDIRTTRLACSTPTAASLSSPEGGQRGGDTVAYLAALERQVARLMEEARVLRAQMATP